MEAIDLMFAWLVGIGIGGWLAAATGGLVMMLTPITYWRATRRMVILMFANGKQSQRAWTIAVIANLAMAGVAYWLGLELTAKVHITLTLIGWVLLSLCGYVAVAVLPPTEYQAPLN